VGVLEWRVRMKRKLLLELMIVWKMELVLALERNRGWRIHLDVVGRLTTLKYGNQEFTTPQIEQPIVNTKLEHPD
jgi:hypothetical protein